MTAPQEPRSAAANHLTTDELSECAFSPETAAPGSLEHLAGCASCAAEVEDLSVVLTELAALPEPAIPQSVAIRLDAAIVRAWQEADAEIVAAEKTVGSRHASRRQGRFAWRRAAAPLLGALALTAALGVGLGVVLSQNSSTNSPSAAGGAAPGAASQHASQNGSAQTGEEALAQWVSSILPPTASGHFGASPQTKMPMADANCPAIPQRAGYTVLAVSERAFEGRNATLVVYQNAQKPASGTVFAVVYAGYCGGAASQVLQEGQVSR